MCALCGEAGADSLHRPSVGHDLLMADANNVRRLRERAEKAEAERDHALKRAYALHDELRDHFRGGNGTWPCPYEQALEKAEAERDTAREALQCISDETGLGCPHKAVLCELREAADSLVFWIEHHGKGGSTDLDQALADLKKVLATAALPKNEPHA
jgi:hypothetical protein